VISDELVVAEDVMRSGRAGAAVLREMRRRYERDGVTIASLRRCEAEGSDGTELPGCLKVYLPEGAGKFGMVLALASDKQGLGLRYLAFGVRHQSTRLARGDGI
jgi:hypothetical protein